MNNNEVMMGDGFYVSYNPNTKSTPLAKVVDELLSLLVGEGGGEETALYCKKDDNFYILDGDFREGYKDLIQQGFESCKAYFNEQVKKGHRSNFSD